MDHDKPFSPIRKRERRASSADRRRSLRDLDLQAPGNRDWREKPQEKRPALGRRMTAEEGVDQRVGQAGDRAKGNEIGTCHLPERRLREVFAPEALPAGDCAVVGAEAFGEVTEPAWVGPLPHRADQDNDGREVDLSAKETHRRGRQSLPATVAIAAEAQSEALELG